MPERDLYKALGKEIGSPQGDPVSFFEVLWQNKTMVKKAIKTILCIVLIIIVLIALFFAYLTIREYRPEDEESLEVMETGLLEQEGNEVTAHDVSSYADSDTEYKIMTWNTGYGALGDNADFFMDGGTGVITADRDRVESNVSGMIHEIDKESADFVFLQEVDRDSKRSHNINEEKLISESFEGQKYTFAYNYKADYVPYPWPTLGKIESGLLSLSKYEIRDATRIQLPIPFSWPIRIANLKRCLAVHRIPVKSPENMDIVSDRDLVLVNLHLEAYDDGEGKEAQTEMLREFLESEYKKGNYVIAGGDFNQVFSSVDHSMYPLREDLWQCGEIDISVFESEMAISDDASTDVIREWQFVMDNHVPTCRSLDQPYANADKESFQYYLIDGFIVSPNIEVLSYETRDLGFVYTDHNPVIMKFKLQ